MLRAVKGMNDVLPDEAAAWAWIESSFRRLAHNYGFREMRTPVLEATELFVRSIGETTDIVEKEMYTFVDKGADQLTLRPEGTAPAVRAYLQHAVGRREPITRWSYVGPMFRRERPARGRYRQFWQAGVEVFGDPGPFVDAEVIDMLVRLLRDEIGLTKVRVAINSLGSDAARGPYKAALVAHFEPHADQLSPDSRRRLETNPLRILDSKDERDQRWVAAAPSLQGFLSQEDREHFDALQQALEALGTPFECDPSLVRGLDYYGRTLFEVYGEGGQLGAQNALCGGGRYDGLVESLGGPPTPAFGFAVGIERLLLALSERPTPEAPSVFVAHSHAELRTHALCLLSDLRAAGVSAEADLREVSLKSQMRRANRLGSRWAMILGPDEVSEGRVQVKSMTDDHAESISRTEIVPGIQRLLAGPTEP